MKLLNLRKQGIPTLPSTIELELETNPFLRVDLKKFKKQYQKNLIHPKMIKIYLQH